METVSRLLYGKSLIKVLSLDENIQKYIEKIFSPESDTYENFFSNLQNFYLSFYS